MAIWDWFQAVLGDLKEWITGRPTPVTRQVLLITFAPLIPSRGNTPLYRAIPGWNDPEALVDGLIADMADASGGYANFTIAERIAVPDFTPMVGDRRYTADLYLDTLRTLRPAMEDRADYSAILNQYNILEKVRTNQIDEVWLMGYPFAGFQESRMGGPGAIFCNGDVLPGTESAGRNFIVMGFNYQRGVGEMLESMAHRAESIVAYLYRNTSAEANLWERFTRIDWDHPGQAEVGTVHHGPNAILDPDRDDHQWTETRSVPSRHKTWYNFPNLSGEPEPTSCTAWQDADMTRGHHIWWFKHFPHGTGATSGVSNNWWKAVINPAHIR
jgi:hypothetical protein